MSATLLLSPFASLQLVHRLPRRVRYRYTAVQGTCFESRTLAREVDLLPGVLKTHLNPAAHSLAVDFDPTVTDADGLRQSILALRLPAKASKAGSAQQQKQKELTAIMVSGALLLGVKQLPAVLQTPATLVTSLQLYKEATHDLFEEGINSHVLEAMAVAISTASRDHLAANTTVFMLALGEYLENSIARRSDELLKTLLCPDIGLVWVEQDGAELQIDASELKVGHTVIVGAGNTIPVDGTVLGGEALVNEASMSGESVPVVRSRGALVLSGTVVEEGRLRIYAEHVGAKTAAARIADYVEQSLTAKSQSQLGAARLADRLVPGVLGLAVATWLFSKDLTRTAAVLQADYACALKLATPVAFKSAMSRAGKSGILFKGADALERLGEADTFVFDKTGTLTTGRLEVTDSITFDAQNSAADLIDLAASVEEHYFHPLALAVVEAARKNQGHHFDHKEVEFIAAHGVASVIGGQRIVVGSRHFVVEDEAVTLSEAQNKRIAQLFREGKSLLYIGFGGQLLGVIALKDKLRNNTADTLQRLRAQGVQRIVMLTGDHLERAAELAQQLGLDAFHAELMPAQKAELVTRMARAGARIAFIGDGINDAPALAQAHVGISMQKGADIARMASDIALLEDDIARVADAKELANATMQLIGNNFKLTIGANSAILAAAAFGKLTPAASSVLHNGSTIAILLNALRGGQHTLTTMR